MEVKRRALMFLGLDLGRWRIGAHVSSFDMPKVMSSGGKCGVLFLIHFPIFRYDGEGLPAVNVKLDVEDIID